MADCSQEAQHLATGCLFSWSFFSHELGFSSLVGAGKAVFLELVLLAAMILVFHLLSLAVQGHLRLFLNAMDGRVTEERTSALV